jgi:predicted RNase H-like HicB family nuclease
VRPRTHQEGDPTPAQSEAAAEARVGSALPYPVTLLHQDDDQWVATIDALPGCTARGATPDEAVERAGEAMAAWLASAEREGKSVPEPKSAQSHSGRLLLRMPQSLHAELARLAERESVSLNQFITDVLSGALGWRATGQKARAGGAVRTLDVNDDAPRTKVASVEDESRFSGTVLVVNGILVALAAVVAIVVLIVVLTR